MISESIRVVIALDEKVDRELVEAALPVDGRVNVTGIVHGLDAASAMDDRSAELLLVARKIGGAAIGQVLPGMVRDKI